MEPLVAPSEPAESGKWARVTFMDDNVYEAAKKRIKHLFAMYDSVVVSFSGGKDSLVCLELTREVMDELGMVDEPVQCFFRDEELIPNDVIDLVNSYRLNPRFKMKYICYPTTSQKFFMGQMQTYVQWDRGRPHIRPIPDYAITSLGVPGDPPIDQHEFDLWVGTAYGGAVAVINGIRSYESPSRESSTMNSVGQYGYISPRGNTVFCRVIYDWTERDVFRYFYEAGVSHCKIYEKQMLAGAQLRVATPLHDAAYDTLRRLKEIDPVFYDQLCQLFDHVRTQVEYWHQIDREGILAKYEKSFSGIAAYIKDTYADEGTRQRAMQVLRQVQALKKKARNTGAYADLCGNGYPLRPIFITFIRGQHDRGILPTLDVTNKDREYEEQCIGGGL